MWLIVGFVLLEPFLYPGRSLFAYPVRSMVLVVVAGIMNSIGSWAILAAMKAGGKASVVVPITAVYPLVVCLVAPVLLHEHITYLQGSGIACGLASIFLLAS